MWPKDGSWLMYRLVLVSVIHGSDLYAACHLVTTTLDSGQIGRGIFFFAIPQWGTAGNFFLTWKMYLHGFCTILRCLSQGIIICYTFPGAYEGRFLLF